MTLSIPPAALALILGAALLHAFWNALVKGSVDRALTMALISFGHGILGAVLITIYPVPAVESWPYIALSTFIHLFYYGLLVLAYRDGDLSQVYPIARGVAPLLVSAGAFIFAGEMLKPWAWAGMFAISGGIGLLFFSNGKAKANRTAVLAALGTGLTIAAYTIADGKGVRASGNAMGYIAWLFLFECLLGFAFLFYRRNYLRLATARGLITGIAGGIISATAYGMAIYAMKLTQLGAVSAIRESSVIIAALIGAVWFKERPWKMRVAAACVVACGVILIAFA
jgi:drug/metabolite transporter (DMT)-like permease